MPAASTYDHQLTVFSPEGKLFQLEYAHKAITALGSGTTAFGWAGSNFVCLISERKAPEDKLIVAKSVSYVFPCSRSVGCVGVGLHSDVVAQVQKARSECEDFRYENGFEMSSDRLARRIADRNQVATQKAGKRLLAAGLIFGGWDSERSAPSLWRVDLAGTCIGHRAVAIGPKASELEAAAEKKIRAGQGDDLETALATYCALAVSGGSEVRASEIQVGVATSASQSFQILSDSQVEELLTKIAECAE